MNSSFKSVKLGASLALIFSIASCGPIKGVNTTTSADYTEAGQQIGDLMASVDESTGTSGSFGMLLEGSNRMFARLAPASMTDKMIAELFIVPSAYAATCATALTFSNCLAGTVLRTFGGCTIAGASFNGTVTLNYSNATCQVPNVNDTVTRLPNFTATGLRSSTLSVAQSGTVGQKITRVAANPATFTFSNDGIRRKFTSGSQTLLDYITTVQVAAPISISGTARSGRVLSGGPLQVLNNLTGVTCSYTASGVTWPSTCNCATTGTWTGTCSDGKSSTLTLTGCGTATFSLGTSSGSMLFDRCYGI